MSRIVLTKNEDGSNAVVVGWDHPAMGAFWQEFASKAEILEAETILSAKMTGEYPADLEILAETGVKREGGMFPGIPLANLKAEMPEDLKPLMTDKVMNLLNEHARDQHSGSTIIDLSA